MLIDRRQLLLGSAVLGTSLPILPEICLAQEKKPADRPAKGKMVTPRTKEVIKRGLAYLARRQIRSGRNKGAFGVSGYAGGVAVSSLAGLAFMCGGNTPGEGKYNKNVQRCIDFILDCVQSSGYISAGGAGHDSMYGHGFATLFLAEAYGMSMHDDRERLVGKKLRKAVKLIVETQNRVGGWRYQPRKSDADLSITICQIMALRAARDAGVDVPDKTRDKCIEYVKKSQNSDGGFRYTINGGGSSFPLTAAGIVSLYSSGIYDGPQVEKGLKFLMRQIPGGRVSSAGHYFYYGQYYAVQAMWHAGGDYWQRWYPAIRDQLLALHQDNGSWVDSSVGPEFGTAMACIILQMPNNFLPVFAP